MTTQRIATALSVVLALVLLNNGCGKKDQQSLAGRGSSHVEESGMEDKGKASTSAPAKTENDTGNKTNVMDEDMADHVLVYLGYKNGSSPITKLCGTNLRDAGAMPPGVSLDAGTGIMKSFCNKKVTVLGKAGGTMQVLFKDGATVEFDNGQVWVFEETGWSPQPAPVTGVKSQSPSEDDKKAAQEAFETGFHHFQGNDYDKALEEFDKSLALNPGHIQAMFFKAVIYDRREDYMKSVSAYDAFLKAKPDEPTAWSNRAAALYHVGQWTEALESVEKAIQLKDDANALLNKGNLLLGMAEYDKAIPVLETVKERGARISGDFLDAVKDLSRQFIGKDLPPQKWRPAYGDYLNIVALGSSNRNIPLPPGVAGTRLTFEGTEESPFALLTNLEVWDGAIENVPKYGVLLSPGTRFKQIRMKRGRRMVTIGHIEDWKAVIDKELPISK